MAEKPRGGEAGDCHRLPGCTERTKMPIQPLGEKSTPPAGCKHTLGPEGEHRAAPPLSVLPSPPPTPFQKRRMAPPSEDAWPLLITAWHGRWSTQVAEVGPTRPTELNSIPLLNRGGPACFPAPPPPPNPASRSKTATGPLVKKKPRLGFSLPGQQGSW